MTIFFFSEISKLVLTSYVSLIIPFTTYLIPSIFKIFPIGFSLPNKYVEYVCCIIIYGFPSRISLWEKLSPYNNSESTKL